jgi:hypothetical protein
MDSQTDRTGIATPALGRFGNLTVRDNMLLGGYLIPLRAGAAQQKPESRGVHRECLDRGRVTALLSHLNQFYTT